MRAIVIAIMKLHVCVIYVVKEWNTPGVYGCIGWHTLIQVSSEDMVAQYVGKLVETGELCASCVTEKRLANFSLWPRLNASVSDSHWSMYYFLASVGRRSKWMMSNYSETSSNTDTVIHVRINAVSCFIECIKSDYIWIWSAKHLVVAYKKRSYILRRLHDVYLWHIYIYIFV
jgi:hypothetical protein